MDDFKFRNIAISGKVNSINVKNMGFMERYIAPKGDTIILLKYNAEDKKGRIEVIWDEDVIAEQRSIDLSHQAESLKKRDCPNNHNRC